MRFTIVTPSFNQLDWLDLCVASVRDQVATRAEAGDLSLSEGWGRIFTRMVKRFSVLSVPVGPRGDPSRQASAQWLAVA